MAFHDDVDELLVSHDELIQVCQVLMGIVLDQSLQPLMDLKLGEAEIKPGFASRAMEMQEKFKHDRKRLIADGRIK